MTGVDSGPTGCIKGQFSVVLIFVNDLSEAVIGLKSCCPELLRGDRKGDAGAGAGAGAGGEGGGRYTSGMILTLILTLIILFSQMESYIVHEFVQHENWLRLVRVCIFVTVHETSSNHWKI